MEYTHTASPWDVRSNANGWNILIYSSITNNFITECYNRSICKEEMEADAKRIVECVNACDRFKKPIQEINELVCDRDNLKFERDELQAESDKLKQIVMHDIDAIAALQAERDRLTQLAKHSIELAETMRAEVEKIKNKYTPKPQ